MPILGVAAVGALLFDMLLLSRGLVLSFRDLLDRAGFDVRVLASDAPPFTGPRIPDATAVTRAIAELPEVESVLQLRLRDAVTRRCGDRRHRNAARRAGERPDDAGAVYFIGADPGVRPMWTLLEGHDLPREPGGAPAIVINRNVARAANLGAGGRLVLRCGGRDERAAVT